MADKDKIRGRFGSDSPSVPSGSVDCATVDQWLAEAAESTLSAEHERQLREHEATCPGCRENLARARQGREWLLLLKQEALETPADLVAKILAKTSLRGDVEAERFEDAPGARSAAIAGLPVSFDKRVPQRQPITAKTPRYDAGKSTKKGAEKIPAEGAVPVWQRNSVVVLRRTLLEPRLALVAAMAFFSITLTLNLLGIHLTDLRVADLQPSHLGRAVTRQYADTNARVTRYYENLRIVYEVESRVQQIRRAAQTKPQPQDGNGKRPSGNGHSSNLPANPSSHVAANPAAHGKGAAAPSQPADPLPVVTSPALEAAYHPQSFLAPAQPSSAFVQRTLLRRTVDSTVPRLEFSPALKAFHGASRMIAFSPRRVSTPERRWA